MNPNDYIIVSDQAVVYSNKATSAGIYSITGQAMYNMLVSQPGVPSPVFANPLSLQSATSLVNGAPQISIRWNPATDIVGAAYYQVFRNGLAYATTSASTSSGLVIFTDTNVTANVAYSYSVQAFDLNSNASAVSSVVNVIAR